MEAVDFIKKLYHFNLYADFGFQFNGIDVYDKFTIAYHNKIKDYWYNFISNINVDNKFEFDKIMEEASLKMQEKNRESVIAILPFMDKVYNNREEFLSNNYELLSKEVWQIYDDFKNLDNIKTGCEYDITLEKTTNMKLFAEEMINAYQTGDEKDPYGELDSVYKDVYEKYKEIPNGYEKEFYLVKINNEIVGVTTAVYNNEIYGIYALAVNKKFRAKGIGKEIIRKQLKMCSDKNIKIAFLQTEADYYPAQTYRKIGFKDVCIQYYYKKIN